MHAGGCGFGGKQSLEKVTAFQKECCVSVSLSVHYGKHVVLIGFEKVRIVIISGACLYLPRPSKAFCLLLTFPLKFLFLSI